MNDHNHLPFMIKRMRMIAQGMTAYAVRDQRSSKRHKVIYDNQAVEKEGCYGGRRKSRKEIPHDHRHRQ